MKANELMIGDWVSIKGTSNKVYGIVNENTITYWVGWNTDEPVLLSTREFTPILLTTEILEKNHLRENLCERYPVLGGEHSMVTMHDAFCYVHQLQHALRLCGLTELADNFKVD